jgi:hypothetical protein
MLPKRAYTLAHILRRFQAVPVGKALALAEMVSVRAEQEMQKD